jgi:hypothetical protein
LIVSDNHSTPIFPPQHNKPKTKKMNNTLHTPAPWEINTCNENGPHLDSFFLSASNDEQNERIICRFPTRTGQFSDMGCENLANARLISAAPDLLSALENLMARCVKDAENYAPDGNEPIWAYISDASDAIAKAKGEK